MAHDTSSKLAAASLRQAEAPADHYRVQGERWAQTLLPAVLPCLLHSLQAGGGRQGRQLAVPSCPFCRLAEPTKLEHTKLRG